MAKKKKSLKREDRFLADSSAAYTEPDAPPPYSTLQENASTLIVMADSNKDPLVKGVAKLFNSPDHADVKIYIGKFKLPAHSLVLTVHSEYFQKALKSGFKDGKSKEFEFKGGSGHAYWRVFEYMYTGQYSEESVDILGYGSDLKEYALERFESKIQELWISEAFVDCIREVYTADEYDSRMKNAVVQVARTNIKKLWQRKRFQDLVREIGDFAVDLMAILTASVY
ncbi:hypothetical protein M432DRAFT_668394 [Thermoascus aurantiacus ATCC 26904]